MREIKLLKFDEVHKDVFVVVAEEGSLKQVLSKEEWGVMKDWKEIVLMENYHFVINRFLEAESIYQSKQGYKNIICKKKNIRNF